jgi:hypothetical protein
MRLTFEADERELESAHKIWVAQVLAAMEYLLHSHSVDHKMTKLMCRLLLSL